MPRSLAAAFRSTAPAPPRRRSPPRARGRRDARRRARLADGLTRATSPAGTAAHLTAAIPVDAQAVGLARGDMLALAARLRDPAAIDRDALRLVRRLLCDPCGPLYCPAWPTELRERVAAVLAAIDSVPSADPATIAP